MLNDTVSVFSFIKNLNKNRRRELSPVMGKSFRFIKDGLPLPAVTSVQAFFLFKPITGAKVSRT